MKTGNKKRNICAFLSALLLFALLAGCNEGTGQGEPATATEQTSVTPAPLPSESSVTSEEPSTEAEVIQVSTAGEFLEAIAPNAVIELAPGTYNLTEYLRGASDNISDYVIRTFNDGWQAEIHDVEGLTIRGTTEGSVEVVAEPRYCDVLYFNNCSDIVIENITFGHTIEPGVCEGAVLTFVDCRRISLNLLDLYGCGTYGVVADNTVGITLRDCIIRECSYGMIDLRQCAEVIFEDCVFRDNSGFDMICLSNTIALFKGCTFTGNTGDSFLPAPYHSDSESEAQFEDCTFGPWESEQLNDEGKDNVNDAPGEEDAFPALDLARLKVAPFDAAVLMADEYHILYEIIDSITGEVSFETNDDVRTITFGEDGRGCFWTDNEKGRPFSYEMRNEYSCRITFDDGGKANCGLYADLGGALPDSEEGSTWLVLYLDNESLWFY